MRRVHLHSSPDTTSLFCCRGYSVPSSSAPPQYDDEPSADTILQSVSIEITSPTADAPSALPIASVLFAACSRWIFMPLYNPDKKSQNSSRFEALGFARYLASVHIVLGHMYQGNHLGSFHSFNRFGFTWVPWFFMLSGFILSCSEDKRRQKGATGVGRIAYICRRLETMYPVYIIGVVATIVTLWTIQGAAFLPLPTDVMVSVLLMQGWIPSILEDGLTYLVQVSE